MGGGGKRRERKGKKGRAYLKAAIGGYAITGKGIKGLRGGGEKGEKGSLKKSNTFAAKKKLLTATDWSGSGAE